jgi:hypothetical protein
MRQASKAICLLALGMAAPAHAGVTSVSDAGFSIENSVEVADDARSVYALIATPAHWWSSQHSYSGDAANLTLEPRAGGCFCESLPGPGGSAGSVEHAHVVFAAPDRELRLSGALGPLQTEGATGTLDIIIAPVKDGVRVTMRYVVGGYVRTGMGSIAPMVDKVLSEQLMQLKHVAEEDKR